MLSPQDLARKVGSKVLFIGIECYSWQLSDYVKAAQNARAMGFDTISPKQADGVYRWYTSTDALKQRRNAVLSVGVGFLPFTYCYGPRFGNGQIALEVAIAREIAQVCDGLVCLDLEAEWNGQPGAAALLATSLNGFPGDILLSTWADPKEQNWMGVLSALNGVVSAWVPQVYTNWLDAVEDGEYKSAGIDLHKIFPAIDIASLYAGNNPVAILADGIARGHNSFWIWEYGAAINVASLVKSLIALLPKPASIGTPTSPTLPIVVAPAPTVKPVDPSVPVAALPTPAHTNVVYGKYMIKAGDTLSDIADSLHIKNYYQDLFMPNKTVLDNAAKSHGLASSANGSMIYPGTVIQYPILTA